MPLLTEAESKQLVRCLHCGPKPLGDFRVFRKTPPLKFYEFCRACEDQVGYEKLYEQYAAVGDREIMLAVKAGAQKKEVDDEKARSAEMELVRRDLANRTLAQRHIIPFVKRFMPRYHTGWVHHDICSRLERFVAAVERGESPRLILALPPRAGKSILGSDFFPSWILGKHPEWEIIAASHTVTLSMDFSRKIRSRIEDPAFAAVFPDCQLSKDNSGAEQWRTTIGGGYRAAGVGTGILGMGAHVAIIDDPFKDAESAYSETNRENVKSWFNTTLMTRLAPGGGALIIAQRWHDDDLTGYTLQQRKELLEEGASVDEIDNWELVNYPALAEGDEYLLTDGRIVVDPSPVPPAARLLRARGAALHPERYNEQALKRIRSRMPPAQWNALYQQNPVPDDGDFFTRDMFRYQQHLEGTRDEFVFLTAWDVAIGEKRRNDWSVGVVVAADVYNNMHVVDMVRGRFSTYELVTAACDLIEKWNCAYFGMEHGQIKMTLWPLLVDEMRERKITCSISDELKPFTDKEVRAQPLRGLMQTGRVTFPPPSLAPWVETAQHEMLRFPTGTHDDIVDALAWGARLFQKAPRPNRVKTERRNAERPWRDRLEEFCVPGFVGSTSHMAN